MELHLPHGEEFVQQIRCPLLRVLYRLAQPVVSLQLRDHLRAVRPPVQQNHVG